MSLSSLSMIPETGQHSFFFPTLNAILNGTAGIFLLWGWFAVKKGNHELHKKLMGIAVLISAVFLTSYLYYHVNYDAYKFAGEGVWRPIYFFILISHILLAAIQLPFILRMLYLALKKDYKRHARLARWVWPAWMYVSVTGVIVYLMLYIIFAPVGGSPLNS